MKRASERQITKDDYDSSDEVDGANDQQPGGGEFQRAPAEVMAKRKIIKVRRSTKPPTATSTTTTTTTPNPTNTATAPVSNPFAAAFAPTNSSINSSSTATANPFAALASKSSFSALAQTNGDHKPSEPASAAGDNDSITKKPDSGEELTAKADEKKKEEEAKESSELEATNDEKKESEKENKDNKETVEVACEKDNAEIPSSDKPKDKSEEKPEGEEALKDKESNGESKEEQGVEQPAENENAASFGTTAAGTTTETDTTKKEKENGVERQEAMKKAEECGGAEKKKMAFGGITGSTPIVTFASTAAASGTTTNTENSFNFPSATEKKNGDMSKENGGAGETENGHGTSKAKEEKIDSGEEGEEEMFRSRAKLYVLEGKDSNARWKERGVGALKINKNKESGCARLLMRTEATLRVVLNAALFKSIKVVKATERSVRLQLFDISEGGAAEKPVSSPFLVRFSTKEVVSSFEKAVEDWKEHK